MCDRRVWEPLWRALGMDFPRAYIPLELARTGQEFRDLIDKEACLAGDEGLNLVAFSMGGYLALEYAINNPGRVRSLVAISSSAFGLHDDEKRQRQTALDYLRTHPYNGIADARLKQMIHPDRLQGRVHQTSDARYGPGSGSENSYHPAQRNQRA